MSHLKEATMTKAPLLTKSKSVAEYDGCDFHLDKDLESFRSFIRWIFMDHTMIRNSVISSVVFLIFGVVIPLLSHFVFAYRREDRESYDIVVETSLSAVATLSFACLMSFFNKYGLRSFLFIDKLPDETESVRRSYIDELNGFPNAPPPLNRLLTVASDPSVAPTHAHPTRSAFVMVSEPL
ncbi:hypothetical protein ZOSMA_54G00460 [Zostera marina]|uniref:Uncharacterized protein n=1 Tax=Zostera marina TaxID=29655 RepID=A0A0K9NYV3_ZOSMR|nr:hypothetical protein ZOSMA_54G00460 [Zostera marina]